jgi:hypothetical protein
MCLDDTSFSLHRIYQRELLAAADSSPRIGRNFWRVRLGDFLIRLGFKLKGQPAAKNTIAFSTH